MAVKQYWFRSTMQSNEDGSRILLHKVSSLREFSGIFYENVTKSSEISFGEEARDPLNWLSF